MDTSAAALDFIFASAERKGRVPLLGEDAEGPPQGESPREVADEPADDETRSEFMGIGNPTA